VAVAVRQPAGLGALHPGTFRSLLVISADGELAVALRERVASHEAVVRDVRHAETDEALQACEPFPWTVVGEGPAPAALAAAVRLRPVRVLWRLPIPAALDGRAEPFDHFDALATAVRAALARRVCGVGLAPGQGVRFDDGVCVTSPQLEALLAAHPGGFALPAAAFRQASRAVARHTVAARVLRDEFTGHMVLRCERTQKS